MLAAGILFLLKDLGIWTFWNINWWTVLFVLMGVGTIGWAHCTDCQMLSKGRK